MDIIKIKDLLEDLNKKSEKRKFQGILEMTLKEFVDWIELRERNGVNNNKPYLELYNIIHERGLISADEKVRQEPDVDFKVLDRLDKISIEEMKQYVNPHEYQRYIYRLTNEISTMGFLYRFEPYARTSGRQEWEKIALKWKEILVNNMETILEESEEYKNKRRLPRDVDEKLGLVPNLHNAIKEFLDILDERKGNPKYEKELSYWRGTRSDVLREYYVNHLTLDEIRIKLGKSYEMIRKYRKDFLNDLLIEPKMLCANLHVNGELRVLLEKTKEICKLYNECPASVGEEALELMNYDMANVIDGVEFIVPVGQKGVYNELSKCIMSKLYGIVAPTSPEVIKAKILKSTKVSVLKDRVNLDFIDNVLSCSSIVEKHDNGVRIREELLQTNQDRAARMMYNYCLKNYTVTKSKLMEEYSKKYNQQLTTNISTLRRYGFAPIQEGGVTWRYGTGSLPTMQSAVKEFAERKTIFHYDDLKNELESRGYLINDSSLRTYITNVCKVDNKDSTHFCLKGHCDDFPKFNWRKKNQKDL